MEITEDTLFRAEVIKKIREREFSSRTGIHQSDLNYCLNKAVLRKTVDEGDTDQQTLLYSIGWATQRWLTSQDADEPEKEVNGIIVTLDAIHEGYSWELKASYQSSNRPIEDNPHWLRQMMAQCYVTGTTTAYLTRFELEGDYGSVYPKGKSKEEKAIYRAEHPRPTLHAYRLEFTKEEIERTWGWFLGRKELYEKMLATGKLLPKVLALSPGGGFECDYCTLKEECESGQGKDIRSHRED